MSEVFVVGVAAIAAVAGFAIGFMARRFLAASASRHAEHYAERLVAEARAKQKEIVLEGKDEVLQLRRAAEEEARETRATLQRGESRLLDREEALDRKVAALEERETALAQRQDELEGMRAELKELQQRQLVELERVSGLSALEARAGLMRQLVDEAHAEAQHRVREIERHAIEDGEVRARRVLTTVMQRIAADHTSEATVTVVHLPNDEMKGRIIGREGRNIRALEQATGVDLIIDDTPEAVVLSGFDPVRREIARMALEKLISDGRIHPGRIEETVAKARSEIEVIMRQAGEQAAYDAGVPGLHPELIKLLGRLKYRTSYGQNVLRPLHRDRAPRGAARGRDRRERGRVQEGWPAARHRQGGRPRGRGAARRHRRRHRRSLRRHAGRGQRHRRASPGGRAGERRGDRGRRSRTPSARRDPARAARTSTTTSSGWRTSQQIALSFPGVERCFAIQAGREIRILVRPEDIDDVASSRLARDVVKKIEEQLQYPGQIKVTVIRETRAVDYAR